LTVTKTSDLTRALKFSKYLISAVILSSFLHRNLLKSKSSKVICLQNVKVMPFQLKKIFMACKGKVKTSNSISEESFFQLTRSSMRDLKQIDFAWTYQNQVQFDRRSLAGLRRLEKLTLITQKNCQRLNYPNHRISDDHEASNLVQLVENIAQLPKLKSLHLDLYGLKLPSDLVLNLALLVANSNINDWYLDLIISAQHFDVLKPVLEKVHTLGIFLNGCYYQPQKIKRIQNEHEKNKILCLCLKTPQDSQANLHSILKHCTSLQTLVLGSHYTKTTYKEEDQASQWAHNLHSVVLLNRFDQDKFEEEIFIWNLLKKIHKESKNIKILKIINSNHWMISQSNMKKINFESYPLVCDQFFGIQSLETVQVSIQTVELQYLKNLLFSAHNLTVLKLKLSHPNFTNYWDDNLPFSQFTNLKVLKIAFHGASHEGLWGDNLVHQILEMKDLEVLSIKTKNEWKMPFAKFCVFLNNTVTLPNLRVLKLNTQIIGTLESRHCYQNQIVFLDSNSTIKQMTHSVFGAIMIMVYAQRNLEFCEIQTFHGFTKKRIIYQRYPPVL